MSGKKCEICGRSIKTGRKYCFEHRSIASDNSDKKLESINKYYVKYNLTEFVKNNLKYPLLVFVIIFVIMWIAINLKISFVYKLLLYILYFGAIIFVAIIISERNRLKDRIKNRNPHYINWVKSLIQVEKEDKQFKKSLLK